MARNTQWLQKIVNKTLRFCISAYQYCLSPLLGNVCRFHPSCSEYTNIAIARFGVGLGIWLGLKRVCRCHPWQAGGVDEVPEYRI